MNDGALHTGKATHLDDRQEPDVRRGPRSEGLSANTLSGNEVNSLESEESGDMRAASDAARGRSQSRFRGRLATAFKFGWTCGQRFK